MKTRIKQRDQSDCGPACIASLLAAYGRHESVSRIRQHCRTGPEGTTMLGMIKALKHYGFEARGLQGSMQHVDKLPHPFIAHVLKDSGLHHYLVVQKSSKRGMRVMDPALGKSTCLRPAEFERQWSGALIALVPGKVPPMEDWKGMSRSQRFRLLLAPLKPALLLAALGALFYTLLGLSTSLYLGKITDHVLVSGNRNLLNLMSMVMVALAGMLVALSSGRGLILLRTGQVMDNQLILSYYRHLFALPQRFFDAMKSGEIISRIGDAVKIRILINDAAIGILVNALTLLVSYSTLFLISPRLGLVMSMLLPLYVLLYLAYNQRNRHMERKVMEDAATLEEQLVNSLGAATHIRQDLLRPLNQEKTEGIFNRLLDHSYRSGLNQIMAMASTEGLNRLFSIILLWAGSVMVLGNLLSPGELLTSYALLNYCTGPIQALLQVNRTYQNALIASDRLFEILDLPMDDPEQAVDFRRSDFGEICFDRVVFAYGAGLPQLKDISLRIPVGTITLLRGESGSGKSTLAAMAAQLYPPDGGHIRIGGCDTAYYSRDSLRALLAYVPQHSSFLNGSLLENLAPGEADPDLRRLFRLLQKCGLEGMLESLPRGLHTLIQSGGSHFSGGERQRLVLVRALYRDPPFFILDEPTASLDSASERLVNRLLLALREQGKTILLVSHKPHFEAMADQVLCLDQGRLVSASL